MKKNALILLTALLFSSFATVQAQETKVGFVNLRLCVEKSKLGKKERNAFDLLKKQLGENLEKADKELGDLAKKLEDQDYLDGLSPAAEEELKQKFQKLSQEFVRYQNQYYQLLNQANMKMLQEMQREIAKAAVKVRESKKLNFILNDEAAFAFAPSDDVSESVISEMDRQFETENTDGEKEENKK